MGDTKKAAPVAAKKTAADLQPKKVATKKAAAPKVIAAKKAADLPEPGKRGLFNFDGLITPENSFIANKIVVDLVNEWYKMHPEAKELQQEPTQQEYHDMCVESFKQANDQLARAKK